MIRRMLTCIFWVLSLYIVSGHSIVLPVPTEYDDGYFVLKGQRLNYEEQTDSVFFVTLTSFTGARKVGVEIAPDGSFEQRIPVSGIQDLTLHLARGRDIRMFTFPSDTIDISYNLYHVRNTLRIKGKNEERTKELNLCWDLFKKFLQRDIRIDERAHSLECTDEEAIGLANEYYREKIDYIDRYLDSIGPVPFANKFRQETYYEMAKALTITYGGLERLECKYPDMKARRTVLVDGMLDEVVYDSLQFNKLSSELFMTVPAYRAFLERYLRRFDRFFTNAYDYTPRVHYHFGLAMLDDYPEIRDWYLFQILSSGFSSLSDYGELDDLYDDFIARCTEERYLRRIEYLRSLAVGLAEGSPAPDFELPDTEGNRVRLSELFGRTIYMTFWGVNCTASYRQFERGLPRLYEKYRDQDILFLYICVHPGPDEAYKKAIEDYDLKGIHLLVDDWEESGVCQRYFVDEIPRAVLIDREGKIVSGNASLPIMLVRNLINELDEALDLRAKGR